MSTRMVLISGCSGGGKSSLLEEFQRRGYATVEEPGRRIVKEELAHEGVALPWIDPVAFLRRALETATRDYADAERFSGWVFFDRGLVDAAAGLQYLTGEPTLANLKADSEMFFGRIFLTPPWPEIYVTDAERRHGFEEAVAEYGRMLPVYAELGYEVTLLPKTSVGERVDFILQHLEGAPYCAKTR